MENRNAAQHSLYSLALGSLLCSALLAACATGSGAAAHSGAAPQMLSAANQARERTLLDRLGDKAALPPFAEERVAIYLNKLLEKDRAEIERRRAQVWPVVRRELIAAGLPEELGALAYVESRFDPTVRGENCAGLWQFTEPTARKYGLRVDAQVDERLDVEKSSRAAAHYLSDLRGIFGADAPLIALAAYNLGESKMSDELQKLSGAPGVSPADKHNFWALYQRQMLSEETAEYVPKFIAAGIGLLDR